MTPDQDLIARLLPCPFCGGEAEMKDDEYPGYVECIVCYARGGVSGWQGLGPLGIWNNRPAHEAAVQAAVAKAVEACAVIADEEGGWPEDTWSAPTDFANEGRNAASKCIAAAIRSRGVEG